MTAAALLPHTSTSTSTYATRSRLLDLPICRILDTVYKNGHDITICLCEVVENTTKCTVCGTVSLSEHNRKRIRCNRLHFVCVWHEILTIMYIDGREQSAARLVSPRSTSKGESTYE